MASHSEKPEYFIKSPGKDRKAFVIVERFRKSGTSRRIDSKQLDAINGQYLQGRMTFEEAKEAAHREVLKLRKKRNNEISPKPSMRASNERILSEYWKTVYRFKANQLRAKDAAYNRLRRAVQALGDTPLTASDDDLQAAIEYSVATFGGNQRRIVSALRQILRFMGRETHLALGRKTKARPRFLDIDEFRKIVPRLPEYHKILAWVAFATGCRIGEIFALRESNFDSSLGSIFVDGQRLRSRKDGPTKNDRDRHVVVIDEGLPWLSKWLRLAARDRDALRNRRHAAIIKKACIDVFPDDTRKHLTFHDLRHCYAIHLVSMGVDHGLIALSLGDSIQVLQEYYAGYSLAPSGVRALRDQIKDRAQR